MTQDNHPDPADPNACTAKERSLCGEYLACGNKSEAYRRVYQVGRMKNTTIQNTAYKVFGRPRVQALLEAMQQEAAARHRITADRVLGEFAALGFSDIGEVAWVEDGQFRMRNWSEVPERARRAVQAVKAKVIGTAEHKGPDGDAVYEHVQEIEFKLWSKEPALNALARHLGLFQRDNEQARDANMEALLRLIEGSGRAGGGTDA